MSERPDVVTVYEAADGFRWNRKAPNGEIVSESGEAFASLTYARKSARDRNGATVGYVLDSKPWIKPLKRAPKAKGKGKAPEAEK